MDIPDRLSMKTNKQLGARLDVSVDGKHIYRAIEYCISEGWVIAVRTHPRTSQPVFHDGVYQTTTIRGKVTVKENAA